jgi:peroxiredoxin family protein
VRDTPQGKTIIVFSGDLDKVLAAFIIANGAAAMGRPVTMFFTFWGLTALRKSRKAGREKDGHGGHVRQDAAPGHRQAEALPDEHGRHGHRDDEKDHERQERGLPGGPDEKGHGQRREARWPAP